MGQFHNLLNNIKINSASLDKAAFLKVNDLLNLSSKQVLILNTVSGILPLVALNQNVKYCILLNTTDFNQETLINLKKFGENYDLVFSNNPNIFNINSFDYCLIEPSNGSRTSKQNDIELALNSLKFSKSVIFFYSGEINDHPKIKNIDRTKVKILATINTSLKQSNKYQRSNLEKSYKIIQLVQ